MRLSDTDMVRYEYLSKGFAFSGRDKYYCEIRFGRGYKPHLSVIALADVDLYGLIPSETVNKCVVRVIVWERDADPEVLRVLDNLNWKDVEDEIVSVLNNLDEYKWNMSFTIKRIHKYTLVR